jgi:DNA transformation protein and related proteins
LAASDGFVAFVCDQLRPWGGVEPRRMFGGLGLFRNGTMFGLVHQDTLYFRTDDDTVAGYRAAGMAPFSYRRAGRDVALGYHMVPEDVLDESERLAAWAERAYAAALRRRAKSRAG